jgi:uncharacterized protein DUF4384
MIAALLLPLLLAGGPTPDQPAVASHDDPPIQLWISNDRRFLPGDRARVHVRTEDDGYLVVLHVDPEGYLRVLFPLDPDKDNFVRGGKKYEVRSRGDREAFEADRKGNGTVYAAVSREPFRFDGFVVGDHWDYRALAPSRLSDNPEAELNELVRRMAQGSFDYDVLGYQVIERVTYASDYSTVYRSWMYDDPWCYHYSCGRSYYGSPLSISIFFGRPYRRYYYDPYYYAYDPFYNPFFYDPYYYAPIYYPRYVYPRRYYNYPYRDGYYPYPYRYRGYEAYTPYRFRGSDGLYRDRRYDVRRSVNTVYNPPISPVREPRIATPARRVIEDPGEQLPRGVAEKRLVNEARKVQGREIEARRAREPEHQTRAPAVQERGRDRSIGEPRLIRREVEAQPPRQATPPQTQDRGREQPRVERPREEPRRVEPSPQREARPAPREPDRGNAAPRPERGGGRVEGGGGSRPSEEGGRRHR